MDVDLYDEFGNYIGPELDDIDENEHDNHDIHGILSSEEEMEDEDDERDAVKVGSSSAAVVLYEDRKLFPTLQEMYPDAEVLVEEEDTMPITEPIIPPNKEYKFDLVEKEIPETSFSYEFLGAMMEKPQFIRNIAVIGNLHHGKTTLIDMLVRETHYITFDKLHSTKYTDTRRDEQIREISIKAMPMSFILPDSTGKSFLINCIDTPGHCDFFDEVCNALRLADGALVVVDALEGLTAHTERLIQYCLQEGLPMILALSKLDRLPLELKLPPTDAYFKIRHVIAQVNKVIREHYTTLSSAGDRFLSKSQSQQSNKGDKSSSKAATASTKGEEKDYFDPIKGNVLFNSGSLGCFFSLPSFSRLYCEASKNPLPHSQFSKLLWGDVFFNKETRRFYPTKKEANVSNDTDNEPTHTFVQFVLDPFYKVISHVLGLEKQDLTAFLKQKLNLKIAANTFDSTLQHLLSSVMTLLFGSVAPLVDSAVQHIPSPIDSAAQRCERDYQGNMKSEAAESMHRLGRKKSDPLIIQTTLNIPSFDKSRFYALGRVLSGQVTKGQQVRVLGENYSSRNQEDSSIREVEDIYILQGRYKVALSSASAGSLVLLSGLSESIMKTSTVIDLDGNKFGKDGYERVEIISPIRYPFKPVIKMSCEPLVPLELPKMINGLKKIQQAYPISYSKVEETGEHIIVGTGEMYFDCLLKDLRQMYGDLEIRLSDPVVVFQESCLESSYDMLYHETTDKKMKLSFLCEPLPHQITTLLEANALPAPNNNIYNYENENKENDNSMSLMEKDFEIANFYKEKFDFDALGCRVWSFGNHNAYHQNNHHNHGANTNMLVNDTLPFETDSSLLNHSRDHIIHAFQWAVREGPLIEETIRNSKFRLTTLSNNQTPSEGNGRSARATTKQYYSSSGVIIPTVRKSIYSSFLHSNPCLLEPTLLCEIICPSISVSSVYTVLKKRFGYIKKDYSIVGTPLHCIIGEINAMDSFGLETDLRVYTNGSAHIQMMFNNYEIVSGDIMDTTYSIRPLEAAPGNAKARDYLLKTRRRKGLPDDIPLTKYYN